MIARHAALLDALAAEAGLDPRALRAVIAVESAGEGLCRSRPVIRLEVHRFWLEVPLEKRPAVDARFRVLGPRPWEGHEYRQADGSWTPLHLPREGGQALEWEALTVARGIDERAAIRATSWGAGQILGIHSTALGYSTATAFAAAQFAEAQQLTDLVRLILLDPRLVDAIRERDWTVFAHFYNGTGQMEWYAGRIAAAYAAA